MATNKDCTKCPYKIAAKFVEPTIQELVNYAAEIGFVPFDAEYFYYKNHSVGWVDNRGIPYKKWKGVVQTWFRAAVRRGDVKPAGAKVEKTSLEKYNEAKEAQDNGTTK
jgi:hypothetical protein